MSGKKVLKRNLCIKCEMNGIFDRYGKSDDSTFYEAEAEVDGYYHLSWAVFKNWPGNNQFIFHIVLCCGQYKLSVFVRI